MSVFICHIKHWEARISNNIGQLLHNIQFINALILVYVCACTYVFVHVNVRMHVRMMYTLILVYACICVYIRTYVSLHICKYVCHLIVRPRIE